MKQDRNNGVLRGAAIGAEFGWLRLNNPGHPWLSPAKLWSIGRYGLPMPRGVNNPG